jgi:hypothetical protein
VCLCKPDIDNLTALFHMSFIGHTSWASNLEASFPVLCSPTSIYKCVTNKCKALKALDESVRDKTSLINFSNISLNTPLPSP